MRKTHLSLVAALLFVGGALGQTPAPHPAPAVPNAPAVQPAPAPPKAPAKHHHQRGAKSSRAHWLAYEATNHPKFKHFAQAAVAAQFTPAVIPSPSQMSYWGNDEDGDCVTAEEFFAKCIYPVWYSSTGTMLDMPYSLAVTWARQNGYLNGADLTSVMDSMARTGVSYNGTTYTDGPYTSVDYTTWTTLTSAISTVGPVKIGVASSQFDNVPGVGEQNGWIMSGFRRDNSEDHCVSLAGYGTMAQLCQALGVATPSNASQYTQCLLLFTWDSIGIIDFASMNNITAEAWVRNPTTPQSVPPQPTPTPNPTPTPTPTTLTFTLPQNAPAGASITGTVLSYAAPASQPIGAVTITVTVSAPGATSITTTVTWNVAAQAMTIVPVANIPDQVVSPGQTGTLDLSGFFKVQSNASTPAQPVLPSPQSGIPQSLTPPVPNPPVPPSGTPGPIRMLPEYTTKKAA